MILLFLACMPDDLPEGNHIPPEFPNPSITDFVVECNMEEDTWLYVLESDAWTGNGLLWLRDEEGFEEEHPLISSGAARDGSFDRLEIELLIVGDWRDVQRGKSTRWPCSDQEDLSMLVEIYHPKAHTASDCIYVGEPWPEDAPTYCDQPWELVSPEEPTD